jgi:hypothetical protein
MTLSRSTGTPGQQWLSGSGSALRYLGDNGGDVGAVEGLLVGNELIENGK